MIKSHAFLLATLLMVSCSGKKSSGDHSSDLKPQKKTEEISSTTEAELQAEFHSIEGKDVRDKKFLEMVKGSALTGKRLDTKVKSAANYLDSFRFELWKGSSNKSDIAKREAIFTDVAHEFMERLQDHSKHINLSKMSPLYDIKSQKDEFAIYALSIAMDKKLLGILEGSLKADFNKSLSETQLEVFARPENRGIVIGLMEARMNILSALSLKLLTNNAKSNFGQKLEGIFSSASFDHLKSLDMPESLIAEDQILVLLKAAKKSKDFLASLNIKVDMEKNLKKSFRHVNNDNTREDLKALIKILTE